MESIFELKKDAIERHIPIILDDTLETITRYVHKREEDGIYGYHGQGFLYHS